MNIQIFGSKKNNDSKKVERYFKERGIRFQYIDMREKGMSAGEFQSVMRAVGGLDYMIDNETKDQDTLSMIRYMSDEDAREKILENQHLLLLPIVRNGKQATVGYQPEVWKEWQ
ncbi:MAG: ArsC family transcriptional regulator [Lachnospiraceae bacterium]|nr:ArsC family transcriptional regulator [Lachnospiraceae bacterium]